MHNDRNIFATEHLRGNVDSQARFAYCLALEGWNSTAIGERLRKLDVKVNDADIPDLFALGQKLMPVKRK